MTRVPRLVLIAGIAVVLCGCPCRPARNPAISSAAPMVLPLAIQTHTSTSLSSAEAAQIVSDATTVLTGGSGSTSDVACALHFLVESQGSFTTGDGIVNTGFDYDALFSSSMVPTLTGFSDPPGAPATRQVRVISEIHWCGALTASSLAGCSDEPGLRMVVVRRGSDREGILWAHEAGHTRSLSHRNFLLALMNPTILPGHDQLNSAECSTYRK